jgi:hypothetical protein
MKFCCHCQTHQVKISPWSTNEMIETMKLKYFMRHFSFAMPKTDEWEASLISEGSICHDKKYKKYKI